jgi:hypothetical protein
LYRQHYIFAIVPLHCPDKSWGWLLSPFFVDQNAYLISDILPHCNASPEEKWPLLLLQQLMMSETSLADHHRPNNKEEIPV